MRTPRQNSKSFQAAMCLLAAGFLVGCAGKGGSEVGHYSVRVPQTAMYRYGPAQNFGADFNLTQGQHVVMLGKDYGYSRVMTDDGQSGYVATEDLVPAPPPVEPKTNNNSGGGNNRFLANVPPLPPRGTSRRGVSSANNQILQGGALFGEGDLAPLPPLPEGDPLPGEKKKTPGFRVNVRPPGSPSSSTPPPPKAETKTKPGFRINVPTRGTGETKAKE